MRWNTHFPSASDLDLLTTAVTMPCSGGESRNCVWETLRGEGNADITAAENQHPGVTLEFALYGIKP